MNGAAKRYIAVPTLVVALLISLAAFSGQVASASPPDPVPPGFSGFKAMVLGDVCNLRSAPDASSDVRGSVLQGTIVYVVDFQANWAKVKYQGDEAWIAGWLVDIDLRSANVSARIARTDVNLREGPGTVFGVRSTTQKDAVYPAEAKRGHWIRVSLSASESAWVSEELVELETVAGSVNTPVEYKAGDLLVYPAKDSLAVTQTAARGSAVVARLSRGESARLVDCEGAWIVVETASRVKGWVYGPDARVSSPGDPSIAFTLSGSAWSIGKYPTVTVTHTDVNFRSGPDTTYPAVALLSDGDVLRVLAHQGEWIKAISSRGVTGWVAAYLTDGTAAGADPTFSVSAEAGAQSRVLTVTGPFDNALVLPGADGRSVIVSTSAFFNVSATLPVNSFEFGSMRVSGSDVTMSFQGESRYAVRSNAPGRVALEFIPAVTSVGVKAQGAVDVLTIGMLGFSAPEVTRSGDSVTLFLPGASYAGAQLPAGVPQGQAIKSVSVAPRTGGTDVILRTPENTPYLLTKSGNTILARFASVGLAGKRIIVDPGHEAEDPGAIGPTGLSERNVNWEIAFRLADLLKRTGADAILTRGGLYQSSEAPAGWTPGPNEYGGSLAKRTAWSTGADMFISIHNNSSNDTRVGGTTSFVCDSTLNIAESRRLAVLVQRELTKNIGTVDLGTKDSDLYVLREGSAPAVLVETMFMSNPVEEGYLRQAATWDKEAAGLFRAIQVYFTPGA